MVFPWKVRDCSLVLAEKELGLLLKKPHTGINFIVLNFF